MSLVARHLEEHGIPTVVIATARDIVETCGVARLLFTDFPLGNSAGRPNDPESQAFTMELALDLLESATGPRTTLQSPLRWSDDPAWKLDFSNVEQMSEEEIAKRKADFMKVKEVAKMQRAAAGLKIHAAE